MKHKKTLFVCLVLATILLSGCIDTDASFKEECEESGGTVEIGNVRIGGELMLECSCPNNVTYVIGSLFEGC